jgi:hypothetical protein
LEGALGEDLDVWRILRENLDVEKVLGGGFVLVVISDKSLVMVEQRLEETGMRNQMGYWGLHLESGTNNEL